jgi:proteic killer suppression protein
MIKSFRGKKTARFFEGKDVKEFRSFANQLTKRLAVLNDAEKQQDLTELRSNRFELLSGDRKGQCSIRVNKQWRLCFRWESNGPEDVEVVDYH